MCGCSFSIGDRDPGWTEVASTFVSKSLPSKGYRHSEMTTFRDDNKRARYP